MLKITIKEKETGIEKQIQISRTLNGDYVLDEHPEIDAIVMPQKQKILVLPKDEQTDSIYTLQDNLMKFLNKSGVIIPDSISGGNIYGSLQASYLPDPPGGENALQAVIYSIANFIEQQRPIVRFEKDYEDKIEKSLAEPSVQDSTELGEVPQEPFKGSIPKYGFPTRGIYRYNY